MTRGPVFFLLLSAILLGLSASCLQASPGSDIRFQQKHLIVTPPDGWTQEIIDDGLFETCVAYDEDETGLSVIACPAFETSKSFSEVMDEARLDGGQDIENCLLQAQDGCIILYVPISADEGAAFVLMQDDMDFEDEEKEEFVDPDLLIRAKPVLDAFSDFSFPSVLFER